jgi:hypothetical protein
LISGRSTLNATRKTFQTGKTVLPCRMVKLVREIQDMDFGTIEPQRS